MALDAQGNLAAGTSTGGRITKRPGRVGDSPIIGASTYANNDIVAVSTTGLGEKHMVLLTSKEIASLMKYRGMSVQDAADNALKVQLVGLGGSGGAIALDKNGNFATPSPKTACTAAGCAPTVPSRCASTINEHSQGAPRLGLGSRILIGMVVGSVVGAIAGQRVTVLQPIGDLFIRVLVLAAVPLVFFNLLAGLTTLTDLRALGRLTAKLVTYFLATKVIALLLGVAAMEVFTPGVGMTLRVPVEQQVAAPPSVTQVLMDLVPTNVVRAFAEGNVAQVVVLAVLLGVATLLLSEGRGTASGRRSMTSRACSGESSTSSWSRRHSASAR